MFVSRNQVVLPINYEAIIPNGDKVRKLVEIMDGLDYSELYETYLRT